MILFYVKSDNYKLKVAADMVPRFFEQLKVVDLPMTFNHTKDRCGDVYLKIKRVDSLLITVTTYRPWNPWTKAIAYAQNNTIYVNERKLNSLEIADYVGNFCHETMHLLGYQHKGNYVTEYNLRTVPYVIGSLAEAWARSHG